MLADAGEREDLEMVGCYHLVQLIQDAEGFEDALVLEGQLSRRRFACQKGIPSDSAIRIQQSGSIQALVSTFSRIHFTHSPFCVRSALYHMKQIPRLSLLCWCLGYPMPDFARAAAAIT